MLKDCGNLLELRTAKKLKQGKKWDRWGGKGERENALSFSLSFVAKGFILNCGPSVEFGIVC